LVPANGKSSSPLWPVQSGSSENTLRRFLGAAAFLDAAGIAALPPDRRMPVGSVEAVARISKRDPVQGAQLLKDLGRGMWTIATLKQQLANAADPEQTTPSTLGETSESLLDVALCCKERLRELPGDEMAIVRFREWRPLPARFDGVAEPALVLSFPRDRAMAVFDEASLSWATSALRARREFLRSIVMAAAMFDFVCVFTMALNEELLRCVGALRPESSKRIWIEQGPPTEKALAEAVRRFLVVSESTRRHG
jgi:hypothetical protein